MKPIGNIKFIKKGNGQYQLKPTIKVLTTPVYATE